MITRHMLRKWLCNGGGLGISCLLILLAMAGTATVCLGKAPAQEASSLSLSIHLYKSDYIQGEEITIQSTLTNKGQTEMVVKKPSGLGMIVTFDIYQVGEDGKEIYIRRGVRGGPPGWSPHAVRLQPGVSAGSSYDLVRHYPGWFQPGKYKIRGVYHLKGFTSGDFDNPEFQVLSPYVNFEVVAPKGKMLEAFKLLGAVVRGSEEMSLKLLREYPDSPYVIQARLALKRVYYQRKDFDRYIQQGDAILASNPSPMRRALTLYGQGLDYYRKKDFKTAIEKMKASGLRAAEAKAEKWKALEAGPALIPLLKHKNVLIRRKAATDLGRIKCKEAVPELIIALEDKEDSVVLAVATSLGQLKDKRAGPALIPLLKDKNVLIRRTVATALAFVEDKRAIPALIKGFDEETDGETRTWMLCALARFKTEQVDSLLIKSLSDADPGIRAEAATTLGNQGAGNAFDKLLVLMSDESPRVRDSAAYALGRLKDRRAVEALLRALDDSDSRVRYRATYSLYQITGKNLTFSTLDPPEKQQEILRKWKEWGKENNDSFGKGK